MGGLQKNIPRPDSPANKGVVIIECLTRAEPRVSAAIISPPPSVAQAHSFKLLRDTFVQPRRDCAQILPAQRCVLVAAWSDHEV